MARMLDGGGIELFLWYARHELCVALRRQKLVHFSSVAYTIASFIHCSQMQGLLARCQVTGFAGQHLPVLHRPTGFATPSLHRDRRRYMLAQALAKGKRESDALANLFVRRSRSLLLGAAPQW